MSNDPFTPAELEAGCTAVHELEDDTTERYLSVRFEVAAALRAVAPPIAARVRAEDLRRVVEEAEATLPKLREHMLIGLQDADLDGDAGTKRINEWADHVDNQIRAAIARAHRTTEEPDHA